MARTVRIDPLTRIEGNGKVHVELDDAGRVVDSRFIVQEFRGFEKFCEGRMFWEMPLITPRICGVCPTAHHLASAKACDSLLGLEIPEAARLARELMHLAAYIQDHALHFFFLAGPDLLLGPDSDPAMRNIVGLAATDPQLARRAIELRRVGQGMVERIGGPPVHPVAAIPGGVSKALTAVDRVTMLQEIDGVLETARLAVELARDAVKKHAGDFSDGAETPGYFMGLVDEDGGLALYDGRLRVVDREGQEVALFEPHRWEDHVAEHVESWSYTKFPYLKTLGFPKGCYRVGPLARMNVVSNVPTPDAQIAFEEFRAASDGKPQADSFYYHWARMIELVYAAERAREILVSPLLTDEDVRVRADRAAGRGVGVVEAPRGVLMHDYTADMVGRLEKVDLVVATTQNNYAINRAVGAAAARVLGDGPEPGDAALNHIETAIRCYDPCLSCSTHAVGRMPFTLEVARAGQVSAYSRE